MFRVPTDPENPTYDQTFKLSFRQWLFCKADERREWVRRRKIADKITREQWAQRRTPTAQPPQQPPPGTSQGSSSQVRNTSADPAMRTLGRLARIEVWLATIQLAALLIPLILGLLLVVGLAWFFIF